ARPACAHFLTDPGTKPEMCGHIQKSAPRVIAIVSTRPTNRSRWSRQPHQRQAGAFTTNGHPNVHSIHVHHPCVPVRRVTEELGEIPSQTTHLSGNCAL